MSDDIPIHQLAAADAEEDDDIRITQQSEEGQAPNELEVTFEYNCGLHQHAIDEHGQPLRDASVSEDDEIESEVHRVDTEYDDVIDQRTATNSGSGFLESYNDDCGINGNSSHGIEDDTIDVEADPDPTSEWLSILVNRSLLDQNMEKEQEQEPAEQLSNCEETSVADADSGSNGEVNIICVF